MSKDVEDAIAYVRANKTWDCEDDGMALDMIDMGRSLPYSIKSEIHDLMEEYGEDNDLPEGWWLDEVDEDDIFLKL